MATNHISEAAAAADFASLMIRVRAGEEIVIEAGSQPVAILRPAGFPRRSVSESIAKAKAHAEDLGYAPVLDEDFAADLAEIIQNRKPRDTSAWD